MTPTHPTTKRLDVPRRAHVFGALALWLLLLPRADAEEVALALSRLTDASVDVRRSATEALGQQGAAASRAVPALIVCLKDTDVRVRANAAWALGKIIRPTDTIVPVLIETFQDDDWTVRHNAALSLTWVGAPAIPFLEKALADKRERVRLYAVSALHRIDSGKAGLVVAVLDGLLESESSEIRFITAQTVGAVGAPAAATIPKLIALLPDKNPLVSSNAIFALGAMGAAGKPAIPSLVKFLDPKQGTDVRIAATTALSRIGQDHELWIPALLQMFLPTTSESIPAAAVTALAKIGPPAIPHLLSALRDKDGGVRQFAAETVALIGPAAAPAVPELIGLLNDPGWQMRRTAANALGQIGVADENVLAALRTASTDSDETVRQGAKGALDKLARRKS